MLMSSNIQVIYELQTSENVEDEVFTCDRGEIVDEIEWLFVSKQNVRESKVSISICL